MLFNKPINAITVDDLKSLVADKVLESRTIEYKEALPDNSDPAKNDYRGDVASFANALGGDLIFGIAEKDGEPHDVCGITDNIDAAKQRLENLLLNLVEPRIQGIQIKDIKLSDDKAVLVMRIPRSWNAPHGVKDKEHYRFFTRINSRKAPLDIPALKSAFLMSETISDKVRRFRDERLGRIMAGDTPAELPDMPKMVFHIVPLSGFATDGMIDLKVVDLNKVTPMYTNYWSRRIINFDGKLALADVCYTQLFRNGSLETVTIPYAQPLMTIPFYTGNIIHSVQEYIELYKSIGVSAPIIIMASLLNAKGAILPSNASFRSFITSKPIDRHTLIMPDIYIEDFAPLTDKMSIAQALRPIFDSAWNAVGYEECPDFDNEGNWKPSK